MSSEGRIRHAEGEMVEDSNLEPVS